MKLNFATYNILHGHHSEQILKNLSLLLQKGVNVMCVQEADLTFKDLLDDFVKRKNWEVIYFHNTIACNLAIIWDPKYLTLKDTKKIFLPKLTKLTLVQRIVDLRQDIQRGALSASFLVDNKVIQITNAHLSWEGGMEQTLRQLEYLKSELGKAQGGYEILAGDFNTFIPRIFRRVKERKVEKVLEGWQNLLPDISWSCDVSCSAPQDGITPYANFLNSIGIKMRSRIDYIFGRNIKVLSGEMLNLQGSDHRPLIINFEV